MFVENTGTEYCGSTGYNRAPEGVIFLPRSTEAVWVPRAEPERTISQAGRIVAAKCGACLLRTVERQSQEQLPYESETARRSLCPGVLLLAGIALPAHERALAQTAKACAGSETRTVSYSPRIDEARELIAVARQTLSTGGIEVALEGATVAA